MLANTINLSSGKILFKYQTKHLSSAKKVSFFYELKGRGKSPGIIATTKSLFLGKSLVLCSLKSEKQWISFFKKWNCEFKSNILRKPTNNKISEIANDFCKKYSEISDILIVNSSVYLMLNKKADILVSKFRNLTNLKTYSFLVADLFKAENKSKLEKFSRGVSLLSLSKTIKYLVRYDSSRLKGTDKVKFFYALKGRGTKTGILKNTRSESLAKGVIIVQATELKKLINFFKNWNCRVQKTEVIIEKND